MDDFSILAKAPILTGDIARVQSWCRQQSKKLTDDFKQCKECGFIRHLHGDLRLGNMVYFNGQILAFDCIEFDAQLRHIDIMSEICILFMDLLSQDRTDLAYQFLNRFLEHSGDYAGLSLLNYYTVYRALMRANINLLRMQELRERKMRRFKSSRQAQRLLSFHGVVNNLFRLQRRLMSAKN